MLRFLLGKSNLFQQEIQNTSICIFFGGAALKAQQKQSTKI